MVEKSDKPRPTQADARKERLAAALRENLRRRKAPEAGARAEQGQVGNTKPASPRKP